jgi:hypothetical protein
MVLIVIVVILIVILVSVQGIIPSKGLDVDFDNEGI